MGTSSSPSTHCSPRPTTPSTRPRRRRCRSSPCRAAACALARRSRYTNDGAQTVAAECVHVQMEEVTHPQEPLPWSPFDVRF